MGRIPRHKNLVGPLSLCSEPKLRSLLALLRKNQVATITTNLKIHPVKGEEEVYQELRPYMEQYQKQLVETLKKTNGFFTTIKTYKKAS